MEDDKRKKEKLNYAIMLIIFLIIVPLTGIVFASGEISKAQKYNLPDKRIELTDEIIREDLKGEVTRGEGFLVILIIALVLLICFLFKWSRKKTNSNDENVINENISDKTKNKNQIKDSKALKVYIIIGIFFIITFCFGTVVDIVNTNKGINNGIWTIETDKVMRMFEERDTSRNRRGYTYKIQLEKYGMQQINKDLYYKLDEFDTVYIVKSGSKSIIYSSREYYRQF